MTILASFASGSCGRRDPKCSPRRLRPPDPNHQVPTHPVAVFVRTRAPTLSPPGPFSSSMVGAGGFWEGGGQSPPNLRRWAGRCRVRRFSLVNILVPMDGLIWSGCGTWGAKTSASAPRREKHVRPRSDSRRHFVGVNRGIA